jgi:site-specific DNA-methyltransferase (adenine-specific)
MALLLHGDCLEKMKSIPDKSVDCFICDLPYGCLSAKPLNIPNTENAHRKACPPTKREGNAWDIKIDLVQFWEQVKRLAKDDHTPVLMFCNTRFGAELISSNPDWFRYDLIWNKMRGVGFLQVNKSPMRSHELIYVFSKKGAYYKRIDTEGKPYLKKSKNHQNEQYGVERVEGDNKGTRCVLSVIDVHNTAGHNGNQHPTAKPKELYKWLLERYCREGGTMLDPTAGSFNSVFTAKQMGRKAIGIEKDDNFFYKAVQKSISI